MVGFAITRSGGIDADTVHPAIEQDDLGTAMEMAMNGETVVGVRVAAAAG